MAFLLSLMRRKPSYLRLYKRQFSPAFWRMRHSIHSLRFRWKKLVFGLKRNSGETREKAGILWQVLRIIVGQVIYAVSIVVVLMLTEHYGRVLNILPASLLKADA